MDFLKSFTSWIFLLMHTLGLGLSNILLRRSSVLLVSHQAHYHPGPVFRSVTVTCMMECGELCTADLACVSFNLNKTAGSDTFQCDLLGEILEEGELKPDENVDFYEIFWQCFKSSCYHLRSLKITRTYPEAEVHCSNIGGHVLALETRQESDEVREIYKAPRNSRPARNSRGVFHQWLGVNGSTSWTHSGQKLNFTNWETLTQENDRHSVVTNRAWVWHYNWTSSDKCGFICEKNVLV